MCSWLPVMQNTIEEWSVDYGVERWIVKDATLQAGQHFNILPRFQPHEIRARECHRIWKLRLFDGQATPQMRGLIWEQECNSDSSVTADGALDGSTALMAHFDVGENSLGNSAEQICWPLLWYENGVFTDCSFSRAHIAVKTSFAVPCWTPLRFNLIGLETSTLPSLFFIYFKEKSDNWIGLLGGLAWTACMHFMEGSMFGALPLSILQRLTVGCRIE